MSASNSTSETGPLFTGLPAGVVPYVAILAAFVSAYVHLSLAPMVMEFDSTQGALFVLAGLGFLCGVAVYFTRYWRREFYLVGAAFALAQVVAFFVLGGPVNGMAVASKTAEAVFALAATYLYVTDAPSTTADRPD